MAAAAETQRGHQAPAGGAEPPKLAPELQAALLAFREHQSAAARQPFAEECRTLLASSRYGVLSTVTSAPEAAGFPAGSIVGYAEEAETGFPLFSFSTMSGHTKDVMADARASLTVTAPGFQDAADARFFMTGSMERVPEAELARARETYMAKHPDAFWAAFGDFSFWRLADLRVIRLVGGFARAGSVPPKVFSAARPDALAGKCAAELAAANAAGDAAWGAAITAAVGAELGFTAAKLASIDELGVTLAAARGPDATKVRLPFPKALRTPAEAAAALEAMLAAGRVVARV